MDSFRKYYKKKKNLTTSISYNNLYHSLRLVFVIILINLILINFSVKYTEYP